MKILIRNKKNEKWQAVESATFQDEDELQKFITKTPSLVAIGDVHEGMGDLVAVIREFPLDIGNIDILGFTSDGQIAVVECKLARNADIKRKVIGQLFEYGAGLWGMAYDKLDKLVFDKTQKNLIDYIKQSVDEPDWDQGTFQAHVSDALAKGRFILMIIVDEIDDDLEKIIRFINNSGSPAFSLAAFEMKRFQHDDVDVLVPNVYGLIEKQGTDLTATQKEYIDFFQKCIEALNKILPGSFSSPNPQSYYAISTGLGSIHYEWCFHGRPRSSFGVEIHMEKGDHEQNLIFFRACLKKKDELEAVLGEKVISQESWGQKWARIFIEKNEGSPSEELKEWAAKKMKIMIDILQPELNKLKLK